MQQNGVVAGYPLPDGCFAGHAVFSEPIVPAVFVHSLLLEALGDRARGRRLSLVDVAWLLPIMPSRERSLNVCFEADRFAVRDALDERTFIEGSFDLAPLTSDVAHVEVEVGGEAVATEQFYARLESVGIHYTGKFRTVAATWRTADCLSLEVDPPTDGWSDLCAEVLDLGLQGAILLDSERQLRTIVPARAASMEVVGQVAAIRRISVRATTEKGTYDIIFVDGESQAVASMRGVALKPLVALDGAEPVHVNVSANFTASPLIKYLTHWTDQLPGSFVLRESAYNQALQDLLDTSSIFFERASINYLLFSSEEWVVRRSRASRGFSPVLAADDLRDAFRGLDTCELPNGTRVASLNRYETEYLYDEIVVQEAYEKNGIVVRDGDCVFDIGANIGMFSLHVAASCPNARIFACEPAPATFAVLEANLKAYCRNATALPVGVGEATGKARFSFYRNSSVFSGFKADLDGDRHALKEIIVNQLREKGAAESELSELAERLLADRVEREEHEVEIASLSSLIDRLGVEGIDLLKVDAEKFELQILAGIRAEHWSRISQIVVEVHGSEEANLVRSLLVEKGFSVTSEQEHLLKNSGLYNIYATRAQVAERVAEPDPELLDTLTSALEHYDSHCSNPLFLTVTATSDSLAKNRRLSSRVAWLRNALEERVRASRNIRWLDEPREQCERLNLSCFDPVANRVAHIPYTEEYFAALSRGCARALVDTLVPKRKVLVLDCDNTLWRGVLGEEENPLQLAIDGDHLALQSFALSLKARGILLCVASKNRLQDVIDVFEHHPKMLLRPSDIVSFKVSWNSKSQSLRELSSELNLGVDSFVFVDDNPIECAEVQAALPETLVVELPIGTDWASRIEAIWAYGSGEATNEDAKRTQLYKEDALRRRSELQACSYSDFISQLDLRVEFRRAEAQDLERVAQLYARTNQFTFVKRKPARSELTELASAPHDELFVVQARDRFGDYGAVGVIHVRFEQRHARLLSFMLSCRALGKGVEHQMLAFVGERCIQRAAQTIDLHFERNVKNEPARRFLSEIVGELPPGEPEQTIGVPVRALAEVRFVPTAGAAPVNVASPLPVRLDASLDNGIYQLAYHARDPRWLCERVALPVAAAREHGYGSLREFVSDLFARMLRIPSSEVGDDVEYEVLGLSSLDVIQVVKELSKTFPGIPGTVLFECITVSQLSDYLQANYPERCAVLLAAPSSVASPAAANSAVDGSLSGEQDGIAIIGLAGSYPGANDLDEFWTRLRDGRTGFSDLGKGRWKEYGLTPDAGIYSLTGAVIDGHDLFDPLFFRISPNEATNIDPQQRQFMMNCWQLLEDAGYTPENIGPDVGVFCGVMTSGYGLVGNADSNASLNLDYDHYEIPNRVSYFFDFVGPSIAVDTACSSSLSAVHLACESLRRGECSAAIAGGVHLMLHPSRYAQYCSKNMLSKRGLCTPFSEGADGFVDGEGVGSVLLKPLRAAIRDRDHIYGVIRASAVGGTGRTRGFTVPNPTTQAKLIARCLDAAGLDPTQISYVEAHGTGTALGDPIEIRGLTLAYGGCSPGGENRCGVGSVKSNIGHLEAAAGIASLTKVLLQFKYDTLAPTANLGPINAEISTAGTPFYFVARPTPWPRAEASRIAGISSFGAGGANCHLIVADFQAPMLQREKRERYCFPFSARNDQDLARLLHRHAAFLKHNPVEPLDVEFTLCEGRRSFSERVAFVADGIPQLVEMIESFVAKGHESRDLRAGIFRGSAPRRRVPSTTAEVAQLTAEEAALRWCDGRNQRLPPLNDGGRRTSLPTYAFDLQRYWPAPAQRMRSSVELARVFEFDNESTPWRYRHSSRLLPERRVLNDHVVGGDVLVPAAYILSLVDECARQFLNSDRVSLADVEFLERIRVKAQESRLTIDWSVASDGVSFSVFAEEKLRCRGIVRIGEHVDAPAPTKHREERSFSREDVQAFYRGLSLRRLDYGEAYRRLETVSMCARESAEVTLTGRVASDEERVTSVDAGLHACMLLVDTPSHDLWLPSRVRRFAWLEHSPTIERIRVFAVGSERGTLAFNVHYLCAEQRPVAIAEGVVFQQAQASVGSATPVSVAPPRGLRLRRLEEVSLAQEGDLVLPKKTLWLDLSEVLEGHPAQVLGHERIVRSEVASASATDVHGCPEVRWSDEDRSKVERANVIVLFDGQARSEEPVAILMAYLGIVKSIWRVRRGRPTRICLVYRASDDRSNAYWSALEAVNRTLAKELGSYEFNAVAYENSRQLIDRAALLMSSQNVYLRAGKAYVRRWSEVSFRETVPDDRPISPDGVYIVTGGAGAIGRKLAFDILANSSARVLLLGRRKSTIRDLAELDAFNATSGRVQYHCVDIADRNAVSLLVERCAAQGLDVRGIFHCAGAIDDAFHSNMTALRAAQVATPKIDGALNIEMIAARFAPDFVVYFSSIASALGNIGQTNYAYANGVLDAWSGKRTINSAGKQTRYIAVNWPFWQEGGMRMTEAQHAAYRDEFGLAELETPVAMAALWTILRSDLSQVMVLPSAVARISKGQDEATDGDRRDTRQGLEAVLAGHVAEILNIPSERMDVDAVIADFGFDSITFATLAERINREFGVVINASLFFDKQSIREIAEFLLQSGAEPRMPEEGIATLAHPADVATHSTARDARLVPTAIRDTDVAIVGLDCFFPGADGLAAFRTLLEQGHCAVSPVSAEREYLYGFSGGEYIRDGKSIQGGWIAQYDAFDEAFFNISPAEARHMDPQQRLILQCAWRALEQANLNPLDLKGRRVGVYVGAATHDFDQVNAQAGSLGDAYLATGSNTSVIANRLSYFLDLHGPSEVVNTACSSSLVALMRASRDLQDGLCELAIVGGVNLLLSPSNFELFGKAGMLSPEWRCKTFDASADGYVRGEGVGVAVLKLASRAVRDGDELWAVLKGVAVNHNGKSNSLTSPSTRAQVELLTQAYADSRIDFGRVGYCEAHGTGTPLGDAIELNALLEVNRALAAERSSATPLSLASVKSNLGHLEAAAGMAGLIKVCLALKYRVKFATVNYRSLNPNIRLDAPIEIQERTEPWQANVSRFGELPRVAGVSSFGYGGVNAHAVLEEFVAPVGVPAEIAAAPRDERGPTVFFASARSEASLRRLLAGYRERIPGWKAAGLAPRALEYSQIHCRAQLPWRHVLLFNDWEHLSQLLSNQDGVEQAAPRSDSPPKSFDLDEPSNRGQVMSRLREGTVVRWSGRSLPSARIALPLYPFRDQHYPVPGLKSANASSALHPLLDRNCSTLFEQKFVKRLRSDESVITEHRINGACILPAAACLEIGFQAASRSSEQAVFTLNGCLWRRAIQLEPGQDLPLSVRVVRGPADTLTIEIVSGDGPEASFQCDFELEQEPIEEESDGERSIPSTLGGTVLAHRELYEGFERRGYEYGDSFRSIERLEIAPNGSSVLASLRRMPVEEAYVVQPGLLDAAFQSLVGLFAHSEKAVYLPYALGEITVVVPDAARRLSRYWVRHVADLDGGTMKKANVLGFDDAGNVCLSLRDVVIKRKAPLSVATVLEKLSRQELSLNVAKQLLGA